MFHGMSLKSVVCFRAMVLGHDNQEQKNSAGLLGFGDSSVGKVLAEQAGRPEFKSLISMEKARGVSTYP